MGLLVDVTKLGGIRLGGGLPLSNLNAPDATLDYATSNVGPFALVSMRRGKAKEGRIGTFLGR